MSTLKHFFFAQMSPWIPLWLTLLLVLVFGVIGSLANLVLVGGNLRDENGAIYERMIELAGGKASAKIGIITAASSDAIYNG